METQRHQRERSSKELFWLPHISAWASKAVTIKRYCEEHGLSAKRFGYWRKRLSSEVKASRDMGVTSDIHHEFVEVQTTEASSELLDMCCEVKLSNGIQLTLKGGIPLSQLQQLLTTLQEAS